MKQRELYKFGPYLLDAGEMLLRNAEGVVQLPPKALETLLALVERRGEVATKQQLMDSIWPDTFVEEGNLTQNVFLLRRVLGKTPGGEDYIQTLSKRGYRISVPVTRATPSDAESGLRAADLPEDTPGAMTVVGTERSSAPRRFGMAVVLVIGLILGLGLVVAKLWRLEPRVPRVSGYLQLTHDGLHKTGFITQAIGPVAPLVTDGPRIYFNEGGPATSPVLAEVSAVGGETSVIRTAIGIPQLLDISPDRSALLAVGFITGAAPAPLWSVPVPAGTPFPLAGISAWDATWSPDGRELAYISGDGLYRCRSDGTQPKKLVQLPGAGWRPRWSPDGKIIRLTLVDTRTGAQSLWQVSADGSGLRPMLPGWNGPSAECCGNWTPDGQYFVFQSTRNQATEIWAVRDKDSLFDFRSHAQSVPFQLTSGQLSSLSPVVSPNGKKLYVIGRQLRGEVQRWDSKTQQWVQALGGISAEFVEYSSEGQWVTYVLYPEGTLWKSRADGTERTQLTFAPLGVHEPHWSPDQKYISFQGGGPDTQSRMYKISSDGGKPEPLSDAEHLELAPSWSPDGRSVAFSYAPFVARSRETLGVFTLTLTTHEKQKIPGSEGFIAPVWSPDGRYLAATSIQNQTIELFDFHQKTWSELAPGYGLARWSRDGRFLYYLQYGKESGVMRIRIGDRKIERVASLSGTRQAGSMAGLVFGLTLDGSPIILRDTGTEEIYSLDLQPN